MSMLSSCVALFGGSVFLTEESIAIKNKGAPACWRSLFLHI
jgi:hypothetical protein